MSALDNACQLLKEKLASKQWESKTFADKYKGDFISRSQLSREAFINRKNQSTRYQAS